MSEPIVIELGYIPPAEVRGNSRAHWRKKYHKAQEQKADGYFLGCYNSVARTGRPDGVIQFPKARITFGFHHWRKVDLDNLAIGMKPFVDGLANSDLLIDDDPDHVVYGAHTFTKCKKGESKTIVTIEELA